MPTVDDRPFDGFAHCLNARCQGYAQQQVKAIRRERQWLYTELDGDMPGFERSQVSFHFVDDGEASCPSCGGTREVTDEPRTQYQNLSGHDPNGLLHIRPGDAPDVAALQAEVEALREKLGSAA